MRSVFCRIAVMFVNIHFGGAVSGIASMQAAMSKAAILRANGLATSAAPTTVPPMTRSLFTRPSRL